MNDDQLHYTVDVYLVLKIMEQLSMGVIAGVTAGVLLGVAATATILYNRPTDCRM